MAEPRPYHHGAVRDAMLEATLAALEEEGPHGISLRELARRVGITHGAAAHHFGDKRGLFTAVAAQGFLLLSERLESAWEQTENFAEVGVAYVAFAVAQPAHFQVMFRRDLCDQSDPELVAAGSRAWEALHHAARSVADAAGGDVEQAAVAAWAYVHGIAVLAGDGNLPSGLGEDPVRLTRQLAPLLFQNTRLGGNAVSG